MILLESYYQTKLTYSKLISNSIYTFTDLLPNNSKLFFESLSGNLTDKKFSNGKFSTKSEKN